MQIICFGVVFVEIEVFRERFYCIHCININTKKSVSFFIILHPVFVHYTLHVIDILVI